ncbi:retrovirus-related pol polyprotein from transposon TNT 1-94 [Tanacetum coccineum]|uniref:Retrovirus-related pol polyprotein from transposon TNT 1-94 n=1 Tax=Tanacetum coccineum TaxID=301880 RepID=A0ABQ5HXJ2_9ASTR
MGTIEQRPVTVEETRACFESVYNNLAIDVEKVNTVNHKLRKTNADLTTKLARCKNQEICFEISQEKYDKLERLQNFKIQFLKEAAKFVRDFKSLANEADESLAKHKALESKIERLLRAIVSQDILSIVQSNSVIDTSNLQTELDRTKEQFENQELGQFRFTVAETNVSLRKMSNSTQMFIVYRSRQTAKTRRPQPRANARMWVPLRLRDLEVAFRRNTCFVRNLEGVDLLKGNHTTNLYTINLYEMASASPICLMARATSTKSWLWHQRLSHLNFDTINNLAKNDLVTGLPKFIYHKEHLCPSCEQGKSKRASHPPKPVPNSNQRLHLLHMDLCGPMRIASINGKQYILVIVDDYSRYTWVHFLRSKDEAPEVIKTFLKRITVLLQSPIIIIRTDNGTKFKNQILKEYFDSVGISHQASSVRTPQQNRVVERRNRTLVEAARTMLIFSRASALCYPKKDHEDIRMLVQKGILDLTYRSVNNNHNQQPTEGELVLLSKAMYDDYIGGNRQLLQELLVDELETQQHVQHQPATIADNVPTTPPSGYLR